MGIKRNRPVGAGCQWLVGLLAMAVFWLLALPGTPGRTVQGEDFFGEEVPEVTGEDSSPAADEAPVAGPLENPFARRVPALPFPEKIEWLNTDQPYTLKDFRGRFLLLDFWTYCCINCMHVLPELKKLEQAYPNELVVVGVHSAKFETEKDRKNIEEAILRYEIDHPVVNDSNHDVWNAYGIRSWPTILLIDPTGHVVYGQPGEFRFEELNRVLAAAMPYYRQQGLLINEPLKNKRLAEDAIATPLRFPGKVLADEATERLFISDSNHNRIVIAKFSGELVEVIGSGAIGLTDGGFPTATFNHPQGMALHEETLYVADTENHALRKIDLMARTVTTIAGTGIQARHGWPGLENVKTEADIPRRWVGPPRTTELSSPWALWVHGQALYIAMAGPHQIWKMPLDETDIGPYAGNGREDIVDGALLPRVPYAEGFSSFAQPSGLASTGTQLLVADSEGSSIRSVPLNGRGRVTTILGTSDLRVNRLFTFGDVDGPLNSARLQHPLDVVYHKGLIYVADTYNNKIKMIDAKEKQLTTIAGTGEPGAADAPAQFDEPAGLAFAAGKLYVADTNNHAIRVIDLEQGYQVTTLTVRGLTPPTTTGPAAGRP
jgi:thiol-disulfide isomerase/thioredoxin/DNA-binding beta-propeller fold protein YncE